MKIVRISDAMLTSLIISMVYAKGLGVTQGIMAREVYGDIWVATFLACVKGLLMMLFGIAIIKRAPELNVLEQAGLLLGRWAGKALGVVLYFFFMGAFVTVMITYVYHLMDYFLPMAPTYLFFVVGLGVSLYGLFKGLEVIGRTAFLSLLCIIVFNILLILGALQQMDIRELQPTLQSGFLRTLKASRHNDADWGVATVMTMLLLPQVAPVSRWRRAGGMGLLLGGLVVIIWPILETAVLTPEVTAQYIVSCMQMARNVEIGIFMQRYEMIMVAMFLVPLSVQMMLTLYCATKSAAHVFGTNNLRYLYLPVTLTLGGVGYYYVDSHFRAIRYLEQLWPYLCLPVAYGLPLLLWTAGLLRRKKLRQHGAHSASSPP